MWLFVLLSVRLLSYIIDTAVDPHTFFADPDPAVFLNADTDPDPGPGPA